MKILYVVNATSLHGGATKSLLSMISNLTPKGHEIGVICPDDKGLYKEILKTRYVG